MTPAFFKYKPLPLLKIPYVFSMMVLGSALSLLACKRSEEVLPLPAYIRIFDVRNAGDDKSVFTYDGYPYGNPALDSIKFFNAIADINAQSDDFTLLNFGDFVMGRGRNSFGGISGFFSQPIDYVGNVADPADPNPPLLPYKDGIKKERNLYFPNLSHRVPVAPLINGIDYYKWAALASGTHAVGYRIARRGQFVPLEISIGNLLFRIPYTITSQDWVLETPFYFQPGGIYSLFLLSSDAKQERASVMLRLEEDNAFVYDPKKAYIRFVNAIPKTGNATNDQQSQTFDVYARTLNSGAIQALENDTVIGYNPLLLPGTSAEKKVATALNRFEVNGTLPFIEIDYTTFFSKEGGNVDPTADGVPTTIFYLYPSGDSQATGGSPLYSFILSNVGGSFRFTNDPSNPIVNINYIPALAKTASGYAPTITTVLVGTGGLYYNFEQPAVRQAFLDATGGR
jgi:hypothetical protein